MDLIIDIPNLDRIRERVMRSPELLIEAFAAAGDTAAKYLLEQEGLAAYPPETAANKPPVPYYIRGVGTQTAAGNRYNSERLDEKTADGNLHNSERLGEHWTITLQGNVTTVGNIGVSYADKVHGDFQPPNMARIGWRKLSAAAEESEEEIAKIYAALVVEAIEEIYGS